MTELYFSTLLSGDRGYLLKQVDLQVTSLEELCYFYAKNIILLDEKIMQEDLEHWIEKQLHFPVLSQTLKHIREQKGSYIEYFGKILSELCIFTDEEKKEILSNAEIFANKNENQRRKILGDKLFIRQKYNGAIREYYGLIKESTFEEESDDFKGTVWHNLGCCYGMCFLFDEALECFKEAYSYNFSQKTQDAVAFVTRIRQEKMEPISVTEDSFVHYLDYTAQEGRDNRYKQLMERMTVFRRGVEE